MPIVLKSGSLNLLEPSGPVQACNAIALTFMHISFILLTRIIQQRPIAVRSIQGRIVGWVVNKCGRNASRLNVRYYPSIFLEYKRDLKNVHDSVHHGRVSK